ncbi:MAG: hypothetical protein LUI02_03090 [Clostridiales bacterium]|nr:hypothetical protein [Clostridiales bacterium]
MFGRGRLTQDELERIRKKEELDDQLFFHVEQGRELFDAGLSEMEGSYRQAEENTAQVRENMKGVSALAEQNAKVEESLLRIVTDLGGRLQQEEARQEALVGSLRGLTEETQRLVEENKHFTTPSKYLSEFSSALRMQDEAYSQSLDEMADYGKQMSVLALNAAIEAGRLGESGRQFVEAAEEIKNYAANYDSAVREMRAQLALSEKRIDELEEQVHHIIGLLKDNNVAAARLMKSCGDLAVKADRERSEPISKDVTALGEQVSVMKSADDEIAKAQQRNCMQLDDLVEELESQKKNQKEIFAFMDPVFRHSVERNEL